MPSNDTLLTAALILAIVLMVVWLLRMAVGR
jgi:uncharacterized membrane protein